MNNNEQYFIHKQCDKLKHEHTDGYFYLNLFLHYYKALTNTLSMIILITVIEEMEMDETNRSNIEFYTKLLKFNEIK